MQSEFPGDKNGRGGPSVIRRFARLLGNTPLHPQWFAFFRETRALKLSCSGLRGLVLDIGCAEGKPRAILPQEATYIGLDYYSTAKNWYETRPGLFADAQSLPMRDQSVDHALLLDVLEHIENPDECLGEACRVLKPGGSLIIHVPFLYPVHDAPLDFHRWTRFGLVRAARRNGFNIHSEATVGHPLETAALNLNIAASKTALNWIKQKNPLALLAVVLPVLVLATNSIAWLLARLGPADDLMPYAYRMVWVKS